MLKSDNAIGGYMELHIPKARLDLYPDALAYQSARAAFLALLRQGKPRRVWMPKYICGSMFDPLVKAGIECESYSIDNNLAISSRIELSDDDWLLYVNYFGICSQNVDRILEQYNPLRVVLDQTQAFFIPPRDCLATIYSPRKFFGVPDGGLLFSKLQMSLPDEEDISSFSRMNHLLKRLSLSPEDGFLDYQKADESLQDIEPRRMSRLTQRILLSNDCEDARKRRNMNFAYLHKHLEQYNMIKLDVYCINGPLCYPFMTSNTDLRYKLFTERIFVPTYWPDVLERTNIDDVEHRLSAECLALPIDQRYNCSDMKKILRVVKN